MLFQNNDVTSEYVGNRRRRIRYRMVLAVVPVEKHRLQRAFSHSLSGYLLLCFFMPRSRSGILRGWLTEEEAHQSFEILYHSRQLELLAYTAQSQTVQSDLVLQFRKECFHLPPC
jgi:hypothetical protein